MFVLEPTQQNEEYIEAVMNLYSDYELKLITEDELEEKLKKLQ